MLDYNPTPNFQKKSEILKISDNNPTPEFWATACQFKTSVRMIWAASSAIELKIWKTVNLEQSCCLSTTQCNSIIWKVSYPLFCNCWSQRDRWIIIVLLLFEQLNKQVFNLWKKSLDLSVAPHKVNKFWVNPIIIPPPKFHFLFQLKNQWNYTWLTTVLGDS